MCRKNILVYIQQDATLHSLLYLETTQHVSGGTSTHHQERIQLYLRHLVFLSHGYCYHHAPTVKPEVAPAVVELLMMGVRTAETCWAVYTSKRQVINLRICCIWLVDLFETYTYIYIYIYLFIYLFSFFKSLLLFWVACGSILKLQQSSVISRFNAACWISRVRPYWTNGHVSVWCLLKAKRIWGSLNSISSYSSPVEQQPPFMIILNRLRVCL